MFIDPLGSNVVVKLEKKAKSAGGIFIPDTAREKTGEGMVVALGPCCLPKLQLGDRVVFDRYEGREVELDKNAFVILAEEKVLGVLRAAAPCHTSATEAAAPAA